MQNSINMLTASSVNVFTGPDYTYIENTAVVSVRKALPRGLFFLEELYIIYACKFYM